MSAVATGSEFVRLDAICRIVQGGRQKLTGKDFVTDGGYPAYGAGGHNGNLPSYEFDGPAIVLSAIGARCGKCFQPTGRWSSLANTSVFFPDAARADVRFLWYQLNDESSWHRSGTAQPYIKPADIKAREVYLPPLAEQKRIAAILDAADALRQKRRESLTQLDTLVQSVFLDMFGDPDGQGWSSVTVEAVASDERGAIRTGPFGSQLLHSEFVEAGIPVLGIDNAVANEFRQGEPRFITDEKYASLRRYTVRPGDVLITIMGTCGRCAVVPDDIGTAINTKHLCCITLDRTKCTPEFLHAYFLRHPLARRFLERSAKGAIMSGLNMGIIKSLPIPLVPIELQHEFGRVLGVVEEQKAVQRAHLSELDTLFASLQSRAFRGEL